MKRAGYHPHGILAVPAVCPGPRAGTRSGATPTTLAVHQRVTATLLVLASTARCLTLANLHLSNQVRDGAFLLEGVTTLISRVVDTITGPNPS
jgi:hypothetical protein